MTLLRTTKAALFIDPYWLIGRSAEPDEAVIRALVHAAGKGVTIERVYWYLETDGMPSTLQALPRLTLRACARDDLDDGFELVRAMGEDITRIASSGAFDLIVVVSLDDRLALSLEHAKSKGVITLGVKTRSDDADRRMLRIFDELIEPRIPMNSDGMVSDVEIDGQTLKIIRDAIGQWRTESDDFTLQRTTAFVRGRSGLPRPVDSRLLYLTSHLLGRELVEAEKIAMRSEFRKVLQ